MDQRLLDYSDIEKFCEEHRIKNYEIDSNGFVNVNGGVTLQKIGLNIIPIKFGYVNGYFDCSQNYLESLEGSPYKVGGEFNCAYNRLKNLNNSPKKVGAFVASHNQIVSLDGSPDEISDSFDIASNFNIASNQLRDFKGIKEFSLNEKCYFNCRFNPVYSIYSLFNTPKCIDPLNEYDAIQGDTIVWDRLIEVYHEIGIDIPDPGDVNHKLVWASYENSYSEYTIKY